MSLTSEVSLIPLATLPSRRALHCCPSAIAELLDAF